MNKFKYIALFLSIVMIIPLCFIGCEKTETPDIGVKNINVTIVYDNKKSEKISLCTTAPYLADALVEKGVIEYKKDGYYTTVNGVTADYTKDKGWWCLTKGGQFLNDGLNTQKIADGDEYELTYKKG